MPGLHYQVETKVGHFWERQCAVAWEWIVGEFGRAGGKGGWDAHQWFSLYLASTNTSHYAFTFS